MSALMVKHSVRQRSVKVDPCRQSGRAQGKAECAGQCAKGAHQDPKFAVKFAAPTGRRAESNFVICQVKSEFLVNQRNIKDPRPDLLLYAYRTR